MSRPRRWWWLAGGASALLAGYALWSRSRFEDERSALLRAVERDILAEIRALEADDPIPPPAENAATLYAQAAAVYRPEGQHLLPKVDGTWSTPPEDLAAFVAANAQAIALVERAASMDRCRFPTDYQVVLGGPRPTLLGAPVSVGEYGLHGFMGLLVADARIALAEGRLPEAVRKAVLVPRVARHRFRRTLAHPQEAEWYLRRAGAILDAVFRDPALDAPTARRVVEGLLQWREIGEGEEWNLRFRRLYDDQRIWGMLTGIASPRFEESLRRDLDLPARSRFGGLSQGDLDALRGIRARWTPERTSIRSHRPSPYAGRLTVLRAAFALRVFEMERGRPAPALSDLVPGVLAEVPEDPFADGPLSYETDGTRWAVWSRGKVTVGLEARDAGPVDLDLRIDSREPR